MYNALGELQNWRCAGCGREVKTMPLNVDHFHFHIETRRMLPDEYDITVPGAKWLAMVRDLNRPPFVAKTKVEAMRLAREDALPHSVRGLLCAGRYAGCNRKLGRIDDISWLRKVTAYLVDPPAKKINVENPSKYE